MHQAIEEEYHTEHYSDRSVIQFPSAFGLYFESARNYPCGQTGLVSLWGDSICLRT
nr:MAG TPA: hypothetical protein [Caudoviricetes sp.]